MSDEQFDEQVRRLRAERDRLKALPAESDRWDEQLTGELYCDIYQALPGSGRGAWLKVPRVRGPRHEGTSQRDPGGRERDSSPRITVVCSGRKVHPFQVAVNISPQDGQAWPLVSLPGTHAPSNLLPQPGQSSGECSVILIPERSSPRPCGAAGCGARPWPSFPFQITAHPVTPANH